VGENIGQGVDVILNRRLIRIEGLPFRSTIHYLPLILEFRHDFLYFCRYPQNHFPEAPQGQELDPSLDCGQLPGECLDGR
jgi:hypothetical protein